MNILMGILGLFFVILVICFMAFTIYLYVNFPYLLTFIIMGWLGIYILYQSIKKDKQ
jgi:hypothetical protein